MIASHELLQGNVAQFSRVTRLCRDGDHYISRGKRFLQRRFLRHVIADHRVNLHQTADLAKVDLLYYLTRSRSVGCLKMWEMTMKEATARSVLTVGSRVCWDNDSGNGGEVVEHTYNRCKVRWDDPSEGEYSIMYFTEMGNIGLLPTKRTYKAGDVTNLSAREVGI